MAERVAYIAGLMRRLEWQRGKDAPRLAKLWGLHVRTVEDDSSEASRLVFAEENPGQLKGALLERLHELGEEARTRTEETVTKDGEVVTIRRPDMHSAVRAASEFATVLGIRTERLEHHVELSTLSSEELDEQLALIANSSEALASAVVAAALPGTPLELALYAAGWVHPARALPAVGESTEETPSDE